MSGRAAAVLTMLMGWVSAVSMLIGPPPGVAATQVPAVQHTLTHLLRCTSCGAATSNATAGRVEGLTLPLPPPARRIGEPCGWL
mmetsp:Transcript_11948/g.35243  ORF Transcript_11948/g.35243 Transcript_11948/m.35243 type:complete len:84 (+) Transcript_11948:927-1178(+)